MVPNQSIIQHYDPQNRKRSGRNVGFMSDTETFEPVNGRLVPMQVVSDYADAQKFEQVIEKRSDSLSLCLYCVWRWAMEVVQVPPPRFAGNFEKLKQPTAEKAEMQ